MPAPGAEGGRRGYPMHRVEGAAKARPVATVAIAPVGDQRHLVPQCQPRRQVVDAQGEAPGGR